MATQIQSKRRRFHVEATHQDYRFRLWRLYDDEFLPLRRRSQALREDGFDFVMLQRRSDLGLAEIFVGLSALLGDSGRYFDDYKGSFGFPLLLVLHPRVTTAPMEAMERRSCCQVRSGVDRAISCASTPRQA